MILHFYANYQAVKSIAMETFNSYRLSLFIDTFLTLKEEEFSLKQAKDENQDSRLDQICLQPLESHPLLSIACVNQQETVWFHHISAPYHETMMENIQIDHVYFKQGDSQQEQLAKFTAKLLQTDCVPLLTGQGILANSNSSGLEDQDNSRNFLICLRNFNQSKSKSLSDQSMQVYLFCDQDGGEALLQPGKVKNLDTLLVLEILLTIYVVRWALAEENAEKAHHKLLGRFSCFLDDSGGEQKCLFP